MRYADPNTDGSKIQFKAQYENFIGGKWVPPVKGEYFDNISPVDGKVFTRAPRSSVEDIELALDAAHAAKAQWNSSSPTTRSNILLKIADRLEENLELLAVAETWDNGKPIRETLNADIPLCIDHFRYFAGCIRAQERNGCQWRNPTNHQNPVPADTWKQLCR
jgi:aldehyde dehydrogenase